MERIQKKKLKMNSVWYMGIFYICQLFIFKYSFLNPVAIRSVAISKVCCTFMEKKLAQLFGLVIFFFPTISLYQSILLVDEIVNEEKRILSKMWAIRSDSKTLFVSLVACLFCSFIIKQNSSSWFYIKRTFQRSRLIRL